MPDMGRDLTLNNRYSHFPQQGFWTSKYLTREEDGY